MDKQTFFSLLDKYRDGTASDAERALVEAYYSRLEKAGATELSPEEEALVKEAIYAKVLTGIKEPSAKVIPIRQQLLRWTAVAAVLLIVFGTAAYYLFFNTKHTDQAIPAMVLQHGKDLPPGRNAATLTLADGKTIVLDSSSGTISTQGSVTVINMSGLLSYETGKAADKANVPTEALVKAGQPLYNTVTTARGNQYQLVLADGSKVWLNSASSLRFPAVFTGATREVELNGEGYFEIAKNPSRPFIVNIGGHDGSQVEVLGTHFNVNCYPDEETVKTTLLEGKVKVGNLPAGRQGRQSSSAKATADKSAVLIPGQQAVLTADARLTIHDDIDIDQVMAWKNGWFEFDKTDLRTIMRQISRWYDVDIEYAKTPGPEKFGGRIGRNLNLSNILKVLESQDVHCRLEGKKLIVE
jgi:ferric-dicitrate binding protein FerR (iron transport regulator)